MDDAGTKPGQVFREARQKIGWSQEDVARYIGCHQSSVSRAEDDKPVLGAIIKSLTDMCEKIQSRALRAEDKPNKQTGKAA